MTQANKIADEVEKILVSARTALEQGRDDEALDELEAALRQYPEFMEGGVPVFARAYTESVLTICDRHIGLNRHVMSSAQEAIMGHLVSFVARNLI